MAFNFGLVGAAGFVAPRHMKAIADTGNTLVAACDPHDSVGVIDRYFPEAAFFTETERFDRFLEKRRHQGDGIHYLSICSPNYLHDAHVRLALRTGAHAICEKPLVINPWNLDQLAALEREYQRRVYTVMQLRLLPQLEALRGYAALVRSSARFAKNSSRRSIAPTSSSRTSRRAAAGTTRHGKARPRSPAGSRSTSACTSST